MVEGVTGTGASAVEAVRAARDRGATVVGVLAAVDRGHGAGDLLEGVAVTLDAPVLRRRAAAHRHPRRRGAMTSADAERLWSTLQTMAALSEPGPGVTRLAYTALERQAHAQFAEWMVDAGCEVSRRPRRQHDRHPARPDRRAGGRHRQPPRLGLPRRPVRRHRRHDGRGRGRPPAARRRGRDRPAAPLRRLRRRGGRAVRPGLLRLQAGGRALLARRARRAPRSRRRLARRGDDRRRAATPTWPSASRGGPRTGRRSSSSTSSRAPSSSGRSSTWGSST